SCSGQARRQRYYQSQVSREAWSAAMRARQFVRCSRGGLPCGRGHQRGGAAGDPPAAARLRLAPRGAAPDLAAFDGDFGLPGWVLSGSPDAARQILTAIAAAIITVVGVVFSIVIVALTLTSTQFGPRMLRNFIRDRGTQVTLGTFVATFVYAVLALGAIGQA